MPDDQMPRAIMRPLLRGGICLLIFLLALIIWAAKAPLATTIKLAGHIASDEVSVSIQHPYGGRVAEVLITPQDHVEKGDLLMRLNVDLERNQLKSLTAQKDALALEQHLIRQLLSGIAPSDIKVEHSIVQDAQNMNQKMDDIRAEILEKSPHINLLQDKIQLTRKQLQIIQDRLSQQSALVSGGVISAQKNEALLEKQLSIKARLGSDQARLLALETELASLERREAMVAPSFRKDLLRAQKENAERYQILQGQSFALQAIIDQSEIRAPMSGIVTDLPWPAPKMFVPRGGTIAELTRPLTRPKIALSIPTTSVDQLAAGMHGQIQLPSLPARNLPRIEARLVAISPKARLGEADDNTWFDAVAEFDEDPRALLDTALGRENVLIEDMPVVFLVEGRSVTLADYLITPFLAAFSSALQD